MAIRIERSDMVATIVMDRPEARNAVDGPAARALIEALEEFERDDALRVAVLWGAGGTFCAGADLKARGTERGLRLAPDGHGPMGPTRMAFTKPTIAAVEGYAVAGGLELSLMCDLRVASETAIFGVFCRRWGVPLLDGGTVRLPQLIGLSRALDMILTGRPVDAREALGFGLANRVVPAGAGPRRRRRWPVHRGLPPTACGATGAPPGRARASLPAAMANEFRLGKDRTTPARARRAPALRRRRPSRAVLTDTLSDERPGGPTDRSRCTSSRAGERDYADCQTRSTASPPRCLAPFIGDADEVIARARDADALIISSSPVTRRVMESLEGVKAVMRTGVGYDVIDVAAATELGVVVINVPDVWIREVANHALALLLAWNRKIVTLDREVRAGVWSSRVPGAVTGSLHGETVGIVGLGNIGSAFARRIAALETASSPAT
jgi:enoyl-CoA hydratase